MVFVVEFVEEFDGAFTTVLPLLCASSSAFDLVEVFATLASFDSSSVRPSPVAPKPFSLLSKF